jgi:hypothetical protein
LTKFLGKVEIQNSKTKKPGTRITLDADKAGISVGGNSKSGKLALYDIDGKERMNMNADASILVKDDSEKTIFSVFDKRAAGVLVGTDKDEGGNKAGRVVIRDEAGNNSINLDGANDLIEVKVANSSSSESATRLDGNDLSVYYNGKETAKIGHYTKIVKVKGKKSSRTRRKGEIVKHFGAFSAGGAGHDSFIALKDASGTTVFSLTSNSESTVIPGGKFSYCDFNLGGIGKPGIIVMRTWAGYSSIVLDAQNYTLDVGSGSITIDGKKGSINLKDAITIDGEKGSINLKDAITIDGEKGSINLKDAITIDGEKGDIFLNNADCAEDFDIFEPANAEPGTVMVISDEGKLQQSTKTYDKKVAGVISGAGDYKPGLVLDNKQFKFGRRSISLIGKVYCKVEAESSAIEVGDLLTTSSTPGHAMKAIEPLKSFGSVIGKALRPLSAGRGMIPILIALQ